MILMMSKFDSIYVCPHRRLIAFASSCCSLSCGVIIIIAETKKIYYYIVVLFFFLLFFLHLLELVSIHVQVPFMLGCVSYHIISYV